MAIEFRCGQCGKLLRTGDDTAGRIAQCPECGSQTPIPLPIRPEPAAPLDAEMQRNRHAEPAAFSLLRADGYGFFSDSADPLTGLPIPRCATLRSA